MLDRLPKITPERYALIARVALVMLDAHRPHRRRRARDRLRPRLPGLAACTDTSLYTQLADARVIEFGNRVLTGFVGFAAIGASACSRSCATPLRRDLVWLSAAAAARRRLPGRARRASRSSTTSRPGFVMSHYILSMLILVACVALAWRAHHEPGERRPRRPTGSWRARSWALVGLGAVTIFAGTAATAAGPHAGGAGTGDVIKRLDFKGAETLRFVIEQHARLATILGLAAVALWFLARRRGATRRAAPGADDALPAVGRAGRRRRRAVRARAARRDRLGPRRCSRPAPG